MLCLEISTPTWAVERGSDHQHTMSNHNHGNITAAVKSSKAMAPALLHKHQTVADDPRPGLYRDPNAYTDGYDFSELPKPMMGDSHWLAAVIVDRLEAVNIRDTVSLTYDWQSWLGGDRDRLVLRAEGEIDQGRFKNARNEALWGHALTAYWDTQVGVRYDSGLGADRVWGAFGVQGFAPYLLYVEATAYVGEQGRMAFRLETEYDLLFTQKLILQPRVEVNFYSQSDPSRLVSSGLSNVEAGLRLRYEIKRELAPYIGIEWATTLGSAADIMKRQGWQPEEMRWVAGVHFWF